MKIDNRHLFKNFLLFLLLLTGFVLLAPTASATEGLDSSSALENTEEVSNSENQEVQAANGKQTRASEYVNIPDDVLRNEVIWQLNYYYHLSLTDTGAATTVTKEQMELLTTFHFTRTTAGKISTLEGIQYAVNITSFNLSGGTVVSDEFTSLPAGFGKLKLTSFKVNFGELTNIDELKNMTTLKEVQLTHNNLSDLTGLQGTTNLETLVVSTYRDYYSHQMGNIKDFTGLEDSTKLKMLIFSKYDDDTGATRVGPSDTEPSYDGQGLQSLKGLNCAGTLEVLELGGHPGLKNLNGLENYTALKQLTCVGGPSYNGWRQEYDLPSEIINNGSLSTREKLTFEKDTHSQMYRVRGLQGADALKALESCPALETVDVYHQAVETLEPLAGKTTLRKINAGRNRLTTLEPLSNCLAMEELYVSHNLLSNLKGLNKLDKMRIVDCSQQTAGSRTTNSLQVSRYVSNYMIGLLEDITDLNTDSLVEFHCSDNRLTSLKGLEVPAKLKTLYADANYLTDTKEALKGGVSLESVRLNNNQYVSFKDIGLQDSVNSLKELYIYEQGVLGLTNSITSHADSRTFKSLAGMEKFQVLETFNANCNLIDSDDMQYLPKSLVNLYLDYNEIDSAGLTPLGRMEGGSYAFSKLRILYADSNYIGDVRPLENLPELQTIIMRNQAVRIPEHGGTMTIVDDGSFRGIELDVLKTETNLSSLGVNKGSFGTWHTLDHLFPELKSGTSIIKIQDDNYDLYNDNTTVGFEYSSFRTGAANMSTVYINGTVRYPDVLYNLDSQVKLSIVPDKTEVEVGDTVTWTITMVGENQHLLRKPRFYSSRTNTAGATNHTMETSYPDPEYKYGVRIDINGVHLAVSGGVWGSSVSELNKQVNDANMATIKIVTMVGSGTPGDEVKFTFGTSGDNYSREDVSATVTIKSSIPEELKLIKVPERLDFGQSNQSEKSLASYTLAEEAYTTQEKTDGLYLRVYDSNQGAGRVEWQVNGRLSELKNNQGTTLKNSTQQPMLTFHEMSLEKVSVDSTGKEQVTVIPDTDTSVPNYLKKLSFTAGGASQRLSTAEISKGAGTWNIRIPFHKVTLSVPEDINGKAGYEYSGTLTWTLDAVP